jgi:hypothetical protein
MIQIVMMGMEYNNIMTQVSVVYYVRFQVLTAASMMFRIVFWDVLPWDDGGSTHL